MIRFTRATVVIGAVALCGAMASPAMSANIVVDDFDDAADEFPNDATCDAPGADTCTLRAAIGEASTNADDNDTITFSVSGTHTLTLGQLIINTATVTITGNSGGTTISGGGVDRVLTLGGSTAATISDLTVTGGSVTGPGEAGAGIQGITGTSLTLDHVTISGNSLIGNVDSGAGVYMSTSGSLTISDSLIEGNTIVGTAAFGAGVASRSSSTITGTTFVNNQSGVASNGRGGALGLSNLATHQITNTTISGNSAGSGEGGGIRAEGATTTNIVNSTIAGNSAASASDVGGISAGAPLNLKNVLLVAAGQTGVNCEISGGITAENTISTDGTCVLPFGMGNQESVPESSIGLGPLASNGGPTQTRALGSLASVAVDAASTDCGGLTTDQRGVSRPQGSKCDVGAFELAQDTKAPQTLITRGPKAKVRTRAKRAKVTLRFRSTEAGSRFQCAVDGGKFRACKSPARYRLKPGRHRIRVRAIDAAGNVDATPAVRRVRVIKLRRRR